VKRAQIEREENQNAGDETDPMPGRDFNRGDHDRQTPVTAFVNLIVILILV
jgi:hypothetical protein